MGGREGGGGEDGHRASYIPEKTCGESGKPRGEKARSLPHWLCRINPQASRHEGGHGQWEEGRRGEEGGRLG